MALFRKVAELAEKLAGEAGRLKKRTAIAEAIAAVHAAAPEGEDAGLFALYLAGMPFAEADARKLNAGGALLSKALLKVTGATDAALTVAYRRHGDLGAAAFDLLEISRSEETPVRESGHGASSSAEGLTLAEVSAAFAGMAVARTTAIRAGLVEGLLWRASPLEAKYLLKLMLGDMRIGVKQSLVEEAISLAASQPTSENLDAGHPVSISQVRHAVMLEADLAVAVQRAFAGTLDEARMQLFHPLGFMLASPVDSPEEAVERFTAKTTETVEAFLEDKYDGMRAQVHCGDAGQVGRVAIYSRNREDVTASFPELEEAFAAVSKPLIFDGEILGWDFATARALPFAVLAQRIGRKRVSNEVRQQIPVVFMAFDLMHADGELLLEKPLRERRNRLEAVVEELMEQVQSPLTVDQRKGGVQGVMFAEADGAGMERLMLSPSRMVESAEDIERAYAEARARSNEGVMLKAAVSSYQPGRRGLAWVKLKRELATLDVVVTGAEFGHGKRAGILSDYTFAVRGADGEVLNVGKAYSGLTDAEIAEMSTWMMEHTLEDQGHFREVEPLMVLEVAFNNIMRSSRHASGFALRFPRIVRIRTDKPVGEIDTAARVEEIYQSQVDKPVE
ncbi:MAG: ATP-dependent DNA ligase [Edaphobacter sp.]